MGLSVVRFYAFKRAKIGIKIGMYLELFCVSDSNKLNKPFCFSNYYVKLFRSLMLKPDNSRCWRPEIGAIRCLAAGCCSQAATVLLRDPGTAPQMPLQLQVLQPLMNSQAN